MESSPNITLRPAFAEVVRLLRSEGLPTEDLTAANCENFFFVGPAERPFGLVGLELFGDVALLRSLVVSAEKRGAGAGTALLKHAEDHARRNGVRALYLLTATAEAFFTKHGYVRAPREAAPPSIRETREFAGICPASAAFMTHAF